MTTDDTVRMWLVDLVGRRTQDPVSSVDEINRPMIRHWCEAMGDRNPLYLREGVAPPTMIQSWFLPPMGTVRPPVGSLYAQVLDRLKELALTSVVATNLDQTHRRYARVGERLEMDTRIADVTDRKATRLGSGYFITTESTITPVASADDVITTMAYRRFYFAPAKKDS